MTFDALAMHAVRDELEANLLGGHVEKVVPLSELEVGLRVRSQRRDFNLLMSADPQAARVHLIHETLRRLSEEVTPFLLLMRKYVRDGRIVSVEQPLLERVIKLGIETRQEDGSTSASGLIIEAMGRHSNVILVGQDGHVLDALKRVPPSMSRARPVLPHLPYSAPPAVEKLDPLSPSLGHQLASAASQAPPATALWRFLQESLAGTGPLSAREAAFRAVGEASAALEQVTSWREVAEAVAALFRPLQSREWTPCVVVREGVVVHFAPYLLTQFQEAGVERIDSISEAVERAHTDRLRFRPAESVRAPLRAALQARLDRVRRKEDSLEQALVRGAKAEGLKQSGQAILASVGQILPGQTELAWDGASIVLDPHLNPAENAQRYFKEYTKARDATREIPELLDATRLDRQYLEQMLTLLELAEGEAELRVLGRELAEVAAGTVGAGASSRPARGQEAMPAPPGAPAGARARRDRAARQRSGKPGATRPQGSVKRFTSQEGHQILVGGSAQGNERVTFDLGSGEDVWLHARGIPGAHVLVKHAGREPSRQTVLEAARLAALHSQARGSGKVPVDYTLQRYVKKIKGGPPGLVTYSQEKTLRVDATES